MADKYATFSTNEEFYKDRSEKIDCTNNYLQKYFMAFSKIGIIKRLGSIGREGTLYDDDYYVLYGDRIRKETFLKNIGDFKIALALLIPSPVGMFQR